MYQVFLTNAMFQKEEEKQSTERLKFSCKCSFLEIYNEHITDLLEPSSTNLHVSNYFVLRLRLS